MIAATRDVVEILFYGVIGTVTILTYRKAVATILQPLRTEVFKEQIKKMNELLDVLGSKSEVELRDDMGFPALEQANVWLMMDNYITHMFDVKIDRDKTPYSDEECPAMIADASAFRHADSATYPDPPRPPLDTSREKKEAEWRDYKHRFIPVPRKMRDHQDRIRHILGSPLLPSECATLVKEYLDLVHSNIIALRQVLAECAPLLLDKYPTLDIAERASLAWIGNSYNRRFKPLEPKATELTRFVREYFETDTLLQQARRQARSVRKRATLPNEAQDH